MTAIGGRAAHGDGGGGARTKVRVSYRQRKARKPGALTIRWYCVRCGQDGHRADNCPKR